MVHVVQMLGRSVIRALEHSATKLLLDLLYTSYASWNTDNIDPISRGCFLHFLFFFLVSQFTTLAKDSKHTWSIFWTKYRPKAPFSHLGSYEATDVSSS